MDATPPDRSKSGGAAPRGDAESGGLDRPQTPRSTDDPLIGRAVGGKFVVERLLGAGAMGAVYRAHQTALERPVAIKVMHGGFAADPTYAARFQREARAASRLDHPNLIRVLDYGQESDGLLYIAMEFLDGRDLFAVLVEEWPLTHERIVDVLSQTLSALAEAHDAGVLHRDLKPENIMLLRRRGEDGSPTDLVKVCDFGIAKLVEPGTESQPNPAPLGRKLTSAGLVVGTPEYMSPEQARGESFDVRSDLYSVGVILYQLLTRRLPFEGRTPIDVVFKAMNEAAPPLASVGPTIAPGLDAVCEKAISKRPEDRFQNARDMRAALRSAPNAPRQLVIGPGAQAAVAHAPTQAEFAAPSSASSRQQASFPTSRARTGAWGALVAAAAAGVGLFLVLLRSAGSPPVANSMLVAPPVFTTATAAPIDHLPLDPPPPVSPGPELAIHEVSAPAPTTSAHGSSRRSARDGRARGSAPAEAAPSAPPEPAADPPAPLPASGVAVAPAPAPAPPSPPASTRPPPVLDVDAARVDVGQPKTNNAAATANEVSRAMSPLQSRFTACYRGALARAPNAAGQTSAVLHIESDDQGYVTVARVTGAPLPEAARCVESAAKSAHIAVDTGTANADVPLMFLSQ